MTLQAPGDREDFLFDLSRWNRAGLTRFQYVDGDAAVWLEELRIAQLGLYLRGVEPDDRVPEKWRDLFLKPEADRQLRASPAEFEEMLAWKDLLTPSPIETETGGTRNQRLLDQYERQSTDYAWEIMRAFARAAHIVLGHQDAYANEGYLRTATQWENLRKLAAMVNYQPTPPASATATVALEIEPGKDVIEIARGLAMKYAPPEGGAPLIFETLKPFLAHPDLNAARAEGWNQNGDNLDISGSSTWAVPENTELIQGDLAIMTGTDISAVATTLNSIERDREAGQATLKFDPKPTEKLKKGGAFLLIEPDGVQLGLPSTTGNQIVIQLATAGSYSAGAIVEITYTDDGGVQQPILAVVKDSSGDVLTLEVPPNTASGDVEVEAFIPFAAGSKDIMETPLEIKKLYFKRSGGAGDPVISFGPGDPRETHDIKIAQKYVSLDDSSGYGYAKIAGTKVDPGKVVGNLPEDVLTPANSVRFEGKPPKSLSQGDWYVARPVDTGKLTAHRVSVIRVEADVYYIEFSDAPPSPHETTEFFGPMTLTLRPADYDRNQDAAIEDGICRLKDLSPDARNLVKTGRNIIVVNEEGGKPCAAQASLISVTLDGSILVITVASEQDFSDWKAGWTRFYLNTVDISHGETKDPKILGSGDAAQKRQSFQFKITEVSFVPSNASLSGVAPDMDVTVDGVKWEFRDISDPTAEGEDAWSVALNEDDTLQIHFRRRLPSGTNNVAVSRHRVGVGAKGTGIPPWSFTKPMKKNRFVTAVVQPFTSAGGADREPVSDIRESAPSHLAANGRAVSLKDIERLCKRHSSVWQAKAREVLNPGAVDQVDVVIVPANGGIVTPTLKRDLVDFVESRALPNVKVTITGYVSVSMQMRVKINVDTGRYEIADVKGDTEAALVAEFALNNRSLGQPVYVAEILAAMERVQGVSSVTITEFTAESGTSPSPWEAKISDRLVAIFPRENQVAVLLDITGVTVAVGMLT